MQDNKRLAAQTHIFCTSVFTKGCAFSVTTSGHWQNDGPSKCQQDT